jgi:aminoglycoside phosphotransferase family enzyme/predicted kinase
VEQTIAEEPSDQSAVFDLLSDPATYRLREPIVRIDTHGAAVFLAGPDVYKVKRAVRFPFMDFSTLDKRRVACEAEVAVNRANAPELYLGVVAITRGASGLTLAGQGEVVEWAVHMRRFDEGRTLDHLANRGEIDAMLVARLASAVEAAHRAAPVVMGKATTKTFRCQMEQVLDGLASAPDVFPTPAVTALQASMRTAFARVEPLLREREACGETRRCHGDLHLGNIVMIEDQPVLFDAIEFDEKIATCDVLYDLAFVLMDLWTRELHREANHLLARYLWLCTDVERQLAGLAALPLFLALRASIRAEVTALRPGDREVHSARARSYLDAAQDFLADAPVELVAVGGLSGTGKTVLAEALAAGIGRPPGAVHLRSDIERKRLAHHGELDRLPDTAYRPESSAMTYERLRKLAAITLAAGQSVVVDATHRRSEDRNALRDIAGRFGARFTGLWLDAPTAVRTARVTRRRLDASDATPEVASAQDRDEVGDSDWQRLDVSGPLQAVIYSALAAMGKRPRALPDRTELADNIFKSIT